MSLILYHNEEQKRLAHETTESNKSKHKLPLATEIQEAKQFYEAEDYHQKYRLQQYPSLTSALGIKSREDLFHSTAASRFNGYVMGHGSMEQFQKDDAIVKLPGELKNFIVKALQRGPVHAC